MNLTFNNKTFKNLKNYELVYTKLFSKTIKTLNKNGDFYCSVTFVNEFKIKKINSKYRNINKSTDVISFAFLDDKREKIIGNVPIDLGEIYICFQVAKRNAKKYGNSLDRELRFLFVHGLLHLFGYDHHTLKEEKIMFPLQEKILGGK